MTPPGGCGLQRRLSRARQDRSRAATLAASGRGRPRTRSGAATGPPRERPAAPRRGRVSGTDARDTIGGHASNRSAPLAVRPPARLHRDSPRRQRRRHGRWARHQPRHHRRLQARRAAHDQRDRAGAVVPRSGAAAAREPGPRRRRAPGDHQRVGEREVAPAHLREVDRRRGRLLLPHRRAAAGLPAEPQHQGSRVEARRDRTRAARAARRGQAAPAAGHLHLVPHGLHLARPHGARPRREADQGIRPGAADGPGHQVRLDVSTKARTAAR